MGFALQSDALCATISGLGAMDGTKLIAAYCRVSTLEQKKNGNGIEIQVRDVTLFAQSQGLLINRFYRDEAQSGVAEDRPALRRLLKQCLAGQIETVIIPSLDRLSRDVRLAENLFWEFQQHGIRIFIADMPNYDGQDRKDVLIRQIREAIAEENRKDIIERLWKGRQERIRRGLCPGGNIPYGYQRNGNGFVAHEGEAEIVRMIFDLANQGLLASKITAALNEKSLVRRNGKPWTRRQISGILRRKEIYEHGVIHYGAVLGVNKNLVLLAKNGYQE